MTRWGRTLFDPSQPNGNLNYLSWKRGGPNGVTPQRLAGKRWQLASHAYQVDTMASWEVRWLACPITEKVGRYSSTAQCGTLPPSNSLALVTLHEACNLDPGRGPLGGSPGQLAVGKRPVGHGLHADRTVFSSLHFDWCFDRLVSGHAVCLAVRVGIRGSRICELARCEATEESK